MFLTQVSQDVRRCSFAALALEIAFRSAKEIRLQPSWLQQGIHYSLTFKNSQRNPFRREKAQMPILRMWHVLLQDPAPQYPYQEAYRVERLPLSVPRMQIAIL